MVGLTPLERVELASRRLAAKYRNEGDDQLFTAFDRFADEVLRLERERQRDERT